MPSISDRSGIVNGRSPPERRGKLLFYTSKRNERETRHVLAAATTLHLPPEAIRNLVELVRSRRRFSGVENRPHLFQWRTREKVLGENKKLKGAFYWAAADLFMWYSDNTEYCTFECVFTCHWSNLHCKPTFLGCAFRAPPLPQRRFASCYQKLIV